MIEAFIAYHRLTPVSELEQTMEAWDEQPGCEPVAIQTPMRKYEILRRIVAERMAKGDYLLIDCGTVPVEEDVITPMRDLLTDGIGIVGLMPEGSLPDALIYTPTGVRLCKHRVIQSWPEPVPNSSYDEEHVQAYALNNHKALICGTAHYRRLAC